MIKITSITGGAMISALLVGCTSGGYTPPANVGALLPQPAPSPVLTQTALPVLVQPAANTLLASDTVTLSVPATRDAFGKVISVDGAGSLQAATSLTITAAAAVGQPPAGVAMAGGVNAAVLPLTGIAGVVGGYTGTTATEVFNLYSRQADVLATVASPQTGLTYSDFGEWQLHPVARGVSTLTTSHWAGGSQLTLAMPLTGTATYTGVARGSSLATVGGVTTQYDLSGNITLTANFAGNSLTGNITNISAVNNMGAAPVAAGSFNSLSLSGTINGNAFNGTLTAGARPAGVNPAAIAAGASGNVAGHFYGPAANELTGVWGVSTTAVQAVGAFGAKQ